MRFYEQVYGFHALRTVGKCTSRHLFRWIVAPCKGNPDSGIKKSLTGVIWNPAGKLSSWNSESCALENGTDSSRNLIYYLESGIHGMELSKDPRLSWIPFHDDHCFQLS